MHYSTNKKLITMMTTLLLFIAILPVSAESLFKGGISHSVSPMTPRSWFSSIRASNIGDIVTIVVEESTSAENTVELSSNKKYDLTDEWSPILDKIVPGKGVIPNFDGWGGASKVSNNATIKRANKFTQNIATQVVQVLPNGNLVVQGKKQIVNSEERQEAILSGIVNPRLIDGEGKINSKYVANLQLAIVGKGTVSRAQSDGVVNRLLRFLF